MKDVASLNISVSSCYTKKLPHYIEEEVAPFFRIIKSKSYAGCEDMKCVFELKLPVKDLKNHEMIKCYSERKNPYDAARGPGRGHPVRRVDSLDVRPRFPPLAT